MDNFELKKRIYYHDTDCGGVVYYSNYLKFCEEARTEHLRSKGVDLNELAKKGILFAVGDVQIKYRAPAKYGEEIIISSRIEKVKPASLYFYQEIKRDETLLTECRTRLVLIDTNFKPVVMPKDVSASLGG
ncbi:MAG: YbgC/FadM family acyl-CoA thioesterase [Candidatus Omnitrophica bacterium]|nr:YbgC/FadM family acyl-CoA thioesterase [Candidatus Omnitrophota bacterium]